jgi:putative transcriptional regulator
MAIDLTVAQGSFLAAGPDLLDPNFLHAVVLVCQHSPQGAYGLVINRPSPYSARDVLGAHELLKSAELRMFVGGPVQLEALQVLHRVPDKISGGVQIAADLWIGGDLDQLGRYALEEPEEAARNVRLFMGYAGWGAGQLEFELTAGSWLPAPGDAGKVFELDSASVWREVVGSLGDDYRIVANEPPDPHVN